MEQDEIKKLLTSLLPEKKNITLSSLEIKGVGGGSINEAYRLTVNQSNSFFLKTNKADRYPGLFEKEEQGLEFLQKQQCITIPKVISSGVWQDEQFLLLDWVNPGSRTSEFWTQFGEQLAKLHHCSDQQHGFVTDNYMGALPQKNSRASTWTDFFIPYRLVPQIELALRKHLLPPAYLDMFQHLCNKLTTFFNEEPPSLLHGDLWNGNFLCNDRSLPVLIDPAVYYGHRSMDLGMTTLFGGFDKTFYDAYHYHYPLPANYEEQWEICNLYPLLIHLNLFGTSYLGSIASTLNRFT